MNNNANTKTVRADNIKKVIQFVKDDELKGINDSVNGAKQQLDLILKTIKEKKNSIKSSEVKEKVEVAAQVEEVKPVEVKVEPKKEEPKPQEKVEVKVEEVKEAPKQVPKEQVRKPEANFVRNNGSNGRDQRPRNTENRPNNRNNDRNGEGFRKNSNFGDKTGDNRQNNRQGQNNNGKPYMNKDGKPAQQQNGARNNTPRKPSVQSDMVAVSKPIEKNIVNKTLGKKKDITKKFEEDKKTLNKKTLIKKGFIETNYNDDDSAVARRFKSRKHKSEQAIKAVKIEKAVVTSKVVPIKVLSEKIGVGAAEITKKLFNEGIVKTINESIDYDTAALLCADMEIELILKEAATAEDNLQSFQAEEDAGNLVKRPPVITVMGHVDHGKTSLLDYIRKTKVTAGEAGGITQHIGAYSFKLRNEMITFLDTPGHEAFTAMRFRGALATDIAILVVAGDDGVMPQTIEAISHAKSAKVPIIVAMNKMDKQNTNPDKIKEQLAKYDVVPEEWGGDTIIVPISAKTGMGVDELLDDVLLVAEMQELKANPKASAKGIVIEAKLDKGMGPIATILVKNGTLNVGDTIVSGTVSGRVRAMLNDRGSNVKSAGPSMAVSVIGFSEVPNAGDSVDMVQDEKMAKSLIAERKLKELENQASSSQISLDDVFSKISEGEMKNLNLIVKADVQGSVEAVNQALEKLSNEEVKINIVHSAVGAVNETDVMLAATSGAIIICFNVRPDSKAKAASESQKVDIRRYDIIYDAIEDISKAIKGMLAPKFRENIIGQVEVRNIFRASGVGTIAGCYVTDGKVQRNAKFRLYRDNILVHDGEIASLKRFKDDVKEVAQGYECGITLQNFNDIKEGDIFEIFVIEEY